MLDVHKQLETLLKERGFTGEVSTGSDELEQHSTDESIFAVQPQMVIYPAGVRDVQIAVASVSELQTESNPIHLTARAAGTGLSGGSLNNSVVVNTTRYFDTIHTIDNQDGVIVVDTDPGVYYRDLEKTMNEHGVYVPSFPASKDICTIGGMVVNNAAGPDSLRYGHTAQHVASMDVVLSDGEVYHIKPLEWKDFEVELKRGDQLGIIYRHVWETLLHNEESVLAARPKTSKNSAGYALWDVVSTTVEEFVKGRGAFDLSPVFAGSQGTLGVIVRLQIKTTPKQADTKLVILPIYDLDTVGSVVKTILEHKPTNLELFDGPSMSAAISHPEFFADRMNVYEYKSMKRQLRWTYWWRLKRRIPHFVLMATIPHSEQTDLHILMQQWRKQYTIKPRLVSNASEHTMWWQIRRASYSLSKLADPNKRPAAFLEDMTVSTDKLGEFFSGISELFKQHKVQAFVHGHGGDGHLHFYPLLDFTDPKTAGLVEQMAKDFFALAIKLGGNICGEHNDGIIRTPYLDQIFSSETLEMFSKLEQVCDPQHIFNPGKKVNPRFTIRQAIRHSN